MTGAGGIWDCSNAECCVKIRFLTIYFLHVRLETYVLQDLILLRSFSPVLKVILPNSMFLQIIDALPTCFFFSLLFFQTACIFLCGSQQPFPHVLTSLILFIINKYANSYLPVVGGENFFHIV